MRTLLNASLATLAVSLLLAGCGNSPSSSSSSTPASTSSTPTKSAPSSGGYGY